VKVIQRYLPDVFGVFETLEFLAFCRNTPGGFFIVHHLQGIARIGNAFEAQNLYWH
jgi:hypothetical protein